MENVEQEKENLFNKVESEKVVDVLYEKLPVIAKGLIEKSQDLNIPENKGFFENPDDPMEHEPNWHQWGIITHTAKFTEAYKAETPEFLRQAGLAEFVNEKMAEQIDGLTKNRLLSISIPLHDLGKFTERKLKTGPDGTISHSFKGHEKASGRIIRQPEFIQMLRDQELTANQIEYIAHCAERHYELGLLRDAAKRSQTGFNFALIESELFLKSAQEIISANLDIAAEIGIMYLSDSLAKISLRVKAESDEEIITQRESVTKIIADLGLSPRLVNATLQMPVNMRLVKRYLEICRATE
ncbi:MAG: hypothetical protein WC297_02580 [Candidatus Paceibacterota bacterium]|jgi:hypothetical protein